MQAWQTRPYSRLEHAAPGPTPQIPAARIFDTAAQALVPAGPASGTARMYVCGITPYDATHIGHANTYVAFDLLNRVWRDAGLDVHYVQNITDVDDPLLERATATGVDWTELAHSQIDLFREDMTALNVLPPQDYLGAVESIPMITELIAELQAGSAAYAVDDPDYPDLYFPQAADPAFGSVSHLAEPEALALFAERGGDPDRPGKKQPLDSLLWRLERPGEPAWASPFGNGRPGWHVECTAIALRTLGTAFDVQGGGSDLIFPHHEMSAAHGRVATGQEFARAYVHSGMVGLDGEKMSKSKGNLVFVSRLRADGVDPMAIRLLLLGHHYREDWTYTDADLDAATNRLALWRQATTLDAALDAGPVIADVRAALANDLDAPAALAAVDTWAAASLAIDGDDGTAPALVARATDALLGVALD
ncbi:cysteine--1-D-myo-inosityl 2-amino-2-deoxy-alpha-D-glucopyranoside ligase [Microlunatus ginsengisoli]|uniref:L-cysteine:1D-myo-inositol 2-amino-2-deoxy-alpha-D-glucopyranoside ligase n=1 Tax=Microlunatus ginsengisoli TaxID=363863 RepID=A0ABP6ZEE3_9ACTN